MLSLSRSDSSWSSFCLLSASRCHHHCFLPVHPLSFNHEKYSQVSQGQTRDLVCALYSVSVTLCSQLIAVYTVPAYLPICPSVCLFIYPSTQYYLSIHRLCMCLSSICHLCVYPSIHYLPIHPLSICSIYYLYIHHLCIYPSIHLLSIHPSIFPSIYLCIYLLIHLPPTHSQVITHVCDCVFICMYIWWSVTCLK